MRRLLTRGDGRVESALAQRAGRQRGGQRVHRVEALVDVARRTQQEVHPGLGREDGTLPGAAEGAQRARPERVGDGHAREAETAAQLAWTTSATGPPGGWRPAPGRRPRTHDELDPGRDRRRVRRLVGGAQAGSETLRVTGDVVGVLVRRRPRPGKCLAAAATPVGLLGVEKAMPAGVPTTSGSLL